MCRFAKGLERRLGPWLGYCQQLERELAEAREQRDRLAGALERIDYALSTAEDVMHGAGADDITIARRIIIEALSAVVGGTPNNCQRPELCLLTETCIPCAICPHAVKGGTHE
jgi:hypothetical protein